MRRRLTVLRNRIAHVIHDTGRPAHTSNNNGYSRSTPTSRTLVVESVAMLTRTLAARDPETAAHSRRVSDLACAIATELGVSGQHLALLAQATLLHDIGKVAVPDEILSKPGRLTAEERRIVEQHTKAGYRILAGSPIPVLQLAATIALSHHEAWDGSGYPNQISGLSIPLPARIVHAADYYDAVTHERPYRRPWSSEEALQDMAPKAGTEFDPRVLSALMTVKSPAPKLAQVRVAVATAA